MRVPHADQMSDGEPATSSGTTAEPARQPVEAPDEPAHPPVPAETDRTPAAEPPPTEADESDWREV